MALTQEESKSAAFHQKQAYSAEVDAHVSHGLLLSVYSALLMNNKVKVSDCDQLSNKLARN